MNPPDYASVTPEQLTDRFRAAFNTLYLASVGPVNFAGPNVLKFEVPVQPEDE